MQALSYAGEAPLDYRCTKCGAQGCKLWRQYQTFADNIKLFCVDCGASDQRIALTELHEDGTHTASSSGQRIDQIGWLVPAVPTEDGETYWGYTSVPEAGVHWWKRLPLRAPSAAENEASARQRRQEEEEEAARHRRDDDLTSTLISAAVDIATSFDSSPTPDPTPDFSGGGGDFGGGGASGEW